ncbi:MAG: hypothetical protein A49_16000 [Methyloceanibacter sp.]|nr:MAG: hypothetical protein A49_16000 [Methyloceanibacter sp.]
MVLHADYSYYALLRKLRYQSIRFFRADFAGHSDETNPFGLLAGPRSKAQDPAQAALSAFVIAKE